MKTFSISTLLDGILSFFSTLFLSFCIFRLINTPKVLAVVTSIVVSACVSSAIVVAKVGSDKKRLTKKLTSGEKSKLKNKLAIMSNAEIIDLFADLFEKCGKTITKTEKTIETNSHIFLPLFFPCELSANDCARECKNLPKTDKKSVAMSCAFSPDALSFCLQNQIDVIGIDEIFELVKKHREDFFNSPKSSRKKLPAFHSLFCRKNGLKFIFYGFTLGLFSFFAFYPVYYVLSSTFFIVYGLIALFFGNYVQSTSTTFEEILKD